MRNTATNRQAWIVLLKEGARLPAAIMKLIADSARGVISPEEFRIRSGVLLKAARGQHVAQLAMLQQWEAEPEGGTEGSPRRDDN